MTGVILSDKEINNILNEQDKEIKLLKKENEQLKQTIKDLEVENEAQSNAIDNLHNLLAHEDLEELFE